MAWRLPCSGRWRRWLYVPGVPALGQRLYLWIARNRFRLVPCHGGVCTLPPGGATRQSLHHQQWFVQARGESSTDRKDVLMNRRFVQQMADGETIEDVYLVTDKQLRANRNGNLYLQLELRDRTGLDQRPHVERRRAPVPLVRGGRFPVCVKGKVQLFQGALQMILSHLERAETEKLDLTDFLPHTEHDISELWRTAARRAHAAEQSAPAGPGRMFPDG